MSLRKILTVLVFVGLAVQAQAQPLKVVVTTSHLGVLAKEIGKENVEPVVLIPPGTCPGHYELRPGDVKALADGGVLIYHGWEGFVDGLLKAVRPVRVRTCEIDLSGSWLVPATQAKAAEKLTAFLAGVDKSRADEYRKNFDVFIRAINRLEGEVRSVAYKYKLSGTPVIASVQQKDFLRFLGMDVAATFGRDEDLTPVLMKNILDEGRRRNVRIVVDNLQSGADAGKRIAEHLGADCVVLSNFPGAWPGTETIGGAVQENIARLIEAVRVEQNNERCNRN